MTQNIMKYFAWVMFGASLMHVPLGIGYAEQTQGLSLSQIVLLGVISATELDPHHYDSEGSHCVRAYLDALSPAFLVQAQNSLMDPERALDVRRRNLEEQMVTLLSEKVRNEAKAFSLAAPLLVEWEGLSDGPVAEADFAEQWLTRYPDTRISSFLYLFIAHRLRAGYEASQAQGKKELWPILGMRYRQVLDLARLSDNPLICCVAEDMERQPHVYLEGQGRP